MAEFRWRDKKKIAEKYNVTPEYLHRVIKRYKNGEFLAWTPIQKDIIEEYKKLQRSKSKVA